MPGVNKVILVGRLGKDPEAGGKEFHVANFTLATSENYKDKSGEKKEITDWHNISLYRGLADLALKYLKKGDMVYIEGKMRTKSWEKDGVTHYRTNVIGDVMTMLNTKGSRGDSGTQAQAQETFTAQSTEGA